MFNIICDGIPFENKWGNRVVRAKIKINDFSEDFFLPVGYWIIKDYKKQWVKSLIEGQKDKKHSVLITSMYNPEELNFIQAWIVYYELDKVYIQNKIIFVDDFLSFDYRKINKYI
ncbi:hypothetical protein [Chelonobacter oris]|uniref:hypothetical protein n=1 Tax=Chelonobacter oris TaxID=505317 RepID=UPI002448580C|nr:hypothetical protein [Chelonobacter oris]